MSKLGFDAMHWRHPRLAAGIAVLLGTAATGPGICHLQKAGASAQAVFGLLALAMGLACSASPPCRLGGRCVAGPGCG